MNPRGGDGAYRDIALINAGAAVEHLEDGLGIVLRAAAL